MKQNWFVLMALAACGGAAAVSNPSPSPSPSSSSSSSSTRNVVGKSAASSSASSSAAAPADAGPTPVDLLWETDARVAVSSKVDNNTDLPEHMLDRKEETAWNGKTGDLVGAWIKFRVPEDAWVDHVLMSAGFDKTTPKEDLFLENHRITKVRISRAGKALREVALDPNERKPQKLAVGAQGGEFEIEVLAVAPGTKPSWKEISVSELFVMGTPGKRKPKPEPAKVSVGGYASDAYPYADWRGASFLAACLAWAAPVNRDYAQWVSRQYRPPDSSDSATCAGPQKVLAGKGAIVESSHAVLHTPPRDPIMNHFDGEVLAIRTASEVRVTNIQLSGHDDNIFVKIDFKLKSESWVGDQLVIEVEHHIVTEPDVGERSEGRGIIRTVCDATNARCVTAAK